MYKTFGVNWLNESIFRAAVASEHNQPCYILDLLLSIINVSVQTVQIVKELPVLKFES